MLFVVVKLGVFFLLILVIVLISHDSSCLCGRALRSTRSVRKSTRRLNRRRRLGFFSLPSSSFSVSVSLFLLLLLFLAAACDCYACRSHEIEKLRQTSRILCGLHTPIVLLLSPILSPPPPLFSSRLLTFRSFGRSQCHHHVP